MLTKIVELGCMVPGTHEPRVNLMEREDAVKTASNQLIQFWDTLVPDENYVYVHVIAMSAVEYYGPNNNGDAFYEADLKAEHPKFVTGAHVFLHHLNKDPKTSIGRPIFSFYNDDMHRVELILKVDRKDTKSAKVIEQLKKGEQTYVSMGVKVAFDVCSICGNKAKTRGDYCAHLKYNMKAVLRDGSKVFAHNPGPLNFFDISFVGRPADKIAFALAKIAENSGDIDPNVYSKLGSAALGDLHAAAMDRGAGLRKFADIVKFVDGQAVDVKDLPDPSVFSDVKKGVGSMRQSWPVLPKHDLVSAGVTPPVFASTMLQNGGPWSFSDMDFLVPGAGPLASHRPSAIVQAASMIGNNPLTVDDIIASIFKALLGGGYAIPKAQACRCHDIIAPVLNRRRSIMIKMGALSDIPTERPVQTPDDYQGSPLLKSFVHNMAQRTLTGLGPAMHEEFTVVDQAGNVMKTDRVGKMIAEDTHAAGSAALRGVAGLLALAALGAAVSGRGIERFVSPAVLGGLAYAVNPRANLATTMSVEGVQVPKNSPFRYTGKTAAVVLLPSPTYLAMDYLFSVSS